ncbi:hypothetical protein B0A49_08551 [Cryomyces minteri]|uniref:THUMP domain-containing protein n=1 Tax=Cryomyces minteri TaxID=331657 RepID=A0A4U0WRB4_9PEZI|nr:hypothetical protein B0A49_08551 [Cryomyces minteri]
MADAEEPRGDSKKRKAVLDGDGNTTKKAKTKKQWQTPRNNKGGYNGQQAQTIEPGDAGIWATCQRGQEAKCVGELRDLFEEYAEIIYGDVLHDAEADGGGEEGSADIEAEIKKELEGMRKPTSQPLFTHVRLDIECVMFFKTRAPIEPVAFVHRICEDAAQTPDRKRTRLVQRLSPMSLMGKATETGLAEVARQVLAPHFHGPDSAEKKFAIRPTLRNHGMLRRDAVIQQVATTVGSGHKVDLTNYDLLIINICGISVVGSDFDKLKRYNLAEIYHPSPKGAVESKQS